MVKFAISLSIFRNKTISLSLKRRCKLGLFFDLFNSDVFCWRELQMVQDYFVIVSEIGKKKKKERF